MCKRFIITLAVILCAGVLLFPMTAYAEDNVDETASESGIPPYDGPSHISPDGAATVIDNVFIEGNGLEFFTFSTEAGNVFYLVIDRMRTRDNVYFLNAVTEWDLLPLAEKGGTAPGGSTSGIPSAPGSTGIAESSETPELPEKSSPNGSSNNTLIFMLIGVAAVGIAAYYFKIIRPKKQLRDEDEDEGADDDADDFDDDEEYLGEDGSADDDEE